MVSVFLLLGCLHGRIAGCYIRVIVGGSGCHAVAEAAVTWPAERYTTWYGVRHVTAFYPHHPSAAITPAMPRELGLLDSCAARFYLLMMDDGRLRRHGNCHLLVRICAFDVLIGKGFTRITFKSIGKGRERWAIWTQMFGTWIVPGHPERQHFFKHDQHDACLVASFLVPRMGDPLSPSSHKRHPKLNERKRRPFLSCRRCNDGTVVL